MIVTKEGFLARKTVGFGGTRRGRPRREAAVEKHHRDWWLVKHTAHNNGTIYLGDGRVSLPASLIGKRVRFQLVEVEDEVSRK